MELGVVERELSIQKCRSDILSLLAISVHRNSAFNYVWCTRDEHGHNGNE
ncbi:MAG: hypothetical protein H3C64_13465 [Candidatus Kuenenia stuttgartiensis]|uniref:Uncharacterized protein n=1 Tax=Kuenenia stuttgartiensis TaxID=174633 RepID=A0A2C9CEH2_KUEST|nr:MULTISPECIES: hypothetical protein [Kuenenia]MBW7943357.1 hypothetical protein [Candidatus Kuenenia stuttgartiensis]MBZ0193143.1 hypothetical protein [Candidatus Kuenenia stuttgartiensis]MCL4727829.1 hypothetical protein [Candidatus Kuenenia stuttgartiensis]MCZ7621787.1 hypothetical protein [Candidatus Kuenenia sp.]SOH04164.1 hypothetical protein KSMBR1_1665 [Candidatus Kuenenia stuttgartiensis]